LTIASPRSYQKAGNETKDNPLEIHLLNIPGPLRGIRSSILLPAKIKNTSSTIASMIAGMLETQTGYGCVATSPKHSHLVQQLVLSNPSSNSTCGDQQPHSKLHNNYHGG
jgi:hypothetical protein